jgi:hypothetical protein
MTEQTHGLGFGRFVAGFIGIVAMAALVTGAVAASNGPSHAVVPDPTDTALATDMAGATNAATATIVATESPSSAASARSLMAPASSPTEEVKPGASCNPSLDNKEDASERQAAEQNDNNNNQAPNASESPTLAPTPEPSEPPTCLKVDPDSHGDKMSGKTAEPSARIVNGDGPGHSRGGDEGGSNGQPVDSLPPINTFGR